jgi:adenylate cyclase
VVPAIERGGGVVEHFAGDGVLASFNTAGDQADHASRASATALAIIEAGRPVAATHPDWPIFRAGVNTGPAIVGNVGAEGRRSFTVIGDTTNLAARLLALGEPGTVVVAAATWDRLGSGRDGVSLGPSHVKGKRDPVMAWVLRGLEPAASP